MPMRMPVGRVSASRLPSSMMDSAESPVISSRARGRKLEDPLAKRLPADGVRADEFPIFPAFGQHHVQQAKRERGICSGHRREVPVARRSGPRANRIDGDDECAILPRLKDRPPQMGMRRQDVRAPEHDELREPERLRIHADAVVAKGVAGAESARDRADRLHVTRRAEHVPEPASRTVRALKQAHVAAAEKGPDRLRAVASRSRRAAAPR